MVKITEFLPKGEKANLEISDDKYAKVIKDWGSWETYQHFLGKEVIKAHVTKNINKNGNK